MNIMGHKKQDGRLKTDDSYRSVPVPFRLAKQLLQHKTRQQQKFKDSVKMNRRGLKWSENGYMFLCKTYTPFVSTNLAKPLRQICDKYGLERFAPYALRRSFITMCNYNGMPATTLAEIMGHSTIETTFRFYSKITDQMKQ